MKRHIYACGLIVAGWTACAMPALAAEGTNVVPDASTVSPQTMAVADTATAASLARYGVAKKDPLALVVAARMMQELGVTLAADRKPERDGGASDAAAAKPGDGLPATAAEALKAARNLATGQAPVLALITDAEQAGARGKVGGPATHRDLVRAKTTDRYNIRFEGGKPGRIDLVGDGDATLWLTVKDENGNHICRDFDNARYAAKCEFHPRWTGPFSVQIENTGNTPVIYILSTN